MLNKQNYGQGVFHVTYAGTWSSRERQLGKPASDSLWTGYLTADDPVCICYTGNQRWLLCITLLSWGTVPCGGGYAYSQASSALEIRWQCTTKPPGWLCLEVSRFQQGRAGQSGAAALSAPAASVLLWVEQIQVFAFQNELKPPMICRNYLSFWREPKHGTQHQVSVFYAPRKRLEVLK